MLERCVYERMFIHETLTDILLDVADARKAMDSFEEHCVLGQKRSMQYQLETLESRANGMAEIPDGQDCELLAMISRIHRVQRLVSDMGAVVPIWRVGVLSSERQVDHGTQGNSSGESDEDDGSVEVAESVWADSQEEQGADSVVVDRQYKTDDR